MVDEDRIVIRESDGEMAEEFTALCQELRMQIGGLRTEMIERIGHLKIWMLISLVGSVASVVSMAMNIATLVRG